MKELLLSPKEEKVTYVETFGLADSASPPNLEFQGTGTDEPLLQDEDLCKDESGYK